MDGKVIKEESVGSPGCSGSPVGNVPSGKENRRVVSPFNTSEILTRSRTKVLSKENSHGRHHHHHSHSHQMSESPKGGLGGGEDSRDGSCDSPPPALATSRSSSHTSQSQSQSQSQSHPSHSHSHNNNSSGVGVGVTNGMVSGAFSRTTPSPSTHTPNNNNNICSNNNNTLTNNSAKNGSSSATIRTPSSSSNSSGSGSSTASIFTGDGMLGHGSSGRHIIKIKRFLGTLLHFGCDISPEVGDRVRALVFNLVSGHLSIEVFHHSLQEVTSFPLRPFVLPFLRSHLPLLQREISHLARVAKQNSLSFLRSHEQAIFEAGEHCDIFHADAVGMGLVGKRKSTDSLIFENGDGDSGYVTTPKRHHPSLFSPAFFMVPSNSSSNVGSSSNDYRDYYSSSYPVLPLHPLHSTGHSLHDPRSAPVNSSQGPNSNNNNNNNSNSSNGANCPVVKGNGGPEDEWKNIHVMLNCILSMVEKTKRALAILQNRSFHNVELDGGGGAGGSSSGGDRQPGVSSSWLRRPNSSFPTLDSSEDLKRQAGEMMAQALRATEDRVAEVKRRAEEAVQEVKRQALVELQRAVAAAEARVLCDSRRNDPVLAPTTIESETCWNCGRTAHETCSGCNTARYCSSFCQHKDWESHHTVCRSSVSIERSSTTSESKVAMDSNRSSSPISPINVGHPSPSPDNHSHGGSTH